MRNVTILLAVVVVVALAGQAQGSLTYWQGPTGSPSSQDWTTPGNWSLGLPSYAVEPRYAIVDGWNSEADTCEITSGTETVPVEAMQLILGWNGSAGKVDMSAGHLLTKQMFIGGSSNTGIFIQSGGTVVARDVLRLGRRVGSDATYEFSGGTFVGEGLSGKVLVGYELGLGTLYIGSANGTFKCNVYQQGELDGDGTLKFDIGADGIDGITKIEVTGTATLRDNLVITNQVTLAQGHYVLMTYGSRGGTTFDNVDVSALPSGWSVEYDQGAAGNELWLVPEPATMMLLGIGGMGVLLRRRRK